MARIRTTKPEFWTSEQVVECSPIARLMFIGMWNFCDDFGNHPASVKTLKMEVFPGDEILVATIQSMVDELIKNELIVEYVVDGKAYWHVTGWHHQKIDKPSRKYPEFDEHSTKGKRTVADDIPAEGKGREGNGSKPPIPPSGASVRKDGNPAIELKTFIDSCKACNERPIRDYRPLWEYTEAVGLEVDFVSLAWAEFCRRFMPGGTRPKKKQKDWRQTFRNYVEGNYFKLWMIDQNGKYFLTSQGKQAEKFQESKVAA